MAVLTFVALQDEPCEHNFQALNMANKKASSSCDATSVVAIACARHGCFAPSSLVDMQKGERQRNVDWAFCEAIKTTNMAGILTLLLIYDVMCQYYKHFASRVERNPLLEFPADLRLEKAIGLFHVHGHQDECLFRFATSFIKGAGNQAGEVLESLWSPLNRISPSLRTATLAHRAEVLDDHLNDSNWKKLVSIGVYFQSVKLNISQKL